MNKAELTDELLARIDSSIFGYLKRSGYNRTLETLTNESRFLADGNRKFTCGERIMFTVNDRIHDKNLEEIIEIYINEGKFNASKDFLEFGDELRRLTNVYTSMTIPSGGQISDNQLRLYGRYGVSRAPLVTSTPISRSMRPTQTFAVHDVPILPPPKMPLQVYQAHPQQNQQSRIHQQQQQQQQQQPQIPHSQPQIVEPAQIMNQNFIPQTQPMETSPVKAQGEGSARRKSQAPQNFNQFVQDQLIYPICDVINEVAQTKPNESLTNVIHYQENWEPILQGLEVIDRDFLTTMDFGGEGYLSDQQVLNSRMEIDTDGQSQNGEPQVQNGMFNEWQQQKEDLVNIENVARTVEITSTPLPVKVMNNRQNDEADESMDEGQLLQSSPVLEEHPRASNVTSSQSVGRESESGRPESGPLILDQPKRFHTPNFDEMMISSRFSESGSRSGNSSPADRTRKDKRRENRRKEESPKESRLSKQRRSPERSNKRHDDSRSSSRKEEERRRPKDTPSRSFERSKDDRGLDQDRKFRSESSGTSSSASQKSKAKSKDQQKVEKPHRDKKAEPQLQHQQPEKKKSEKTVNITATQKNPPKIAEKTNLQGMDQDFLSVLQKNKIQFSGMMKIPKKKNLDQKLAEYTKSPEPLLSPPQPSSKIKPQSKVEFDQKSTPSSTSSSREEEVKQLNYGLNLPDTTAFLQPKASFARIGSILENASGQYRTINKIGSGDPRPKPSKYAPQKGERQFDGDLSELLGAPESAKESFPDPRSIKRRKLDPQNIQQVLGGIYDEEYIP